MSDSAQEAWVIVRTRPTPSGRSTLLGAGRARVLEERGDVVLVEILRGSGIVAGHRHELARHDIYPTADRGARTAFEAEVRRFWGERR